MYLYVSSGRGRTNFDNGPSIQGVDDSLLVSMASHKSEIIEYCFNGIIIDGVRVIERTELKERKCYDDKLSKTKFAELEKELRCLLEGGKWQHEHEVPADRIAKLKKEIEEKQDWDWDDDKKQFVRHVPLLGEYIPRDKKVVLYLKNIEDACEKDNVPYYCWVLSTYIHELFHAAHHEAACKNGRQYETIREIEEAMTEFSTLLFLNEMSSDSSEWEKTFNCASKTIEEKQWCLGSLPAYGYGYYLFKNLSCDEAVTWIKQYNQKIGAIDKKNRYVKWYQQMLNPMYPYKDEKLCLELLHSILFNL